MPAPDELGRANLHHDGQTAVICSSRDYTDEWEEDTVDELYWCAPSVESFAYRFLIEGRLVSAIRNRERAGDLAPVEVAYLAHYLPG
ncbi:hypothetical protein [Actinoplanes couchii]|uniref:Uncharacterized protein n=1 Tax=Actinoplanes couchii TaxID=403638 RepID=A0ABQ3XRB5_9ACTN|nr:hypothetical protein [Actinoplanes couchii]MDR6320010.1 hypothetical protein [Actinoplanes couchii]GID61049.1 hypothetical protein Aco03nite_094530 [Actinoplanes couchii]